MPEDSTRGADRPGTPPASTLGAADTIAAGRGAAQSAEISGTVRFERVADRYEVLGLLGSGGMGTVYRARDARLDEVVALKVLRREVRFGAEALESFKREVKLARRVTHVNVARTFDIGEHEGEPFLTMEYVEGEPLSELLGREGALSPARVLEVAQALASGLEAAHSAGVVHRDLKPDNVIVGSDGRVVITDFGVALTRMAPTTRSLVGTPAYMAPEQLEPERPVDARADIYALGAVLYELYTGERAWPGEVPVAVAAARLVSPPPDPRRRRPSIPDSIAAVVMRAMARQPADRYGSAAEVSEALAVAHDERWLAPHSGALVTARSAAHDTPARGVTGLPVPRDDRTVAVLPFRNAGASEDEHLAEGLTEEIIDTLSTTRGLRVRTRGVVAQHKCRDVDPRHVGRELEVQVVVEGSVRRQADVVQVRVRASSVDDGFQLWAQRFERPVRELLVVGDEVARAIANAVTAEVGNVPRGAASDMRVVDLYLRARATLHRGWRQTYAEAADLLEQALALAPCDPHLLSAHAFVRTRLWFADGDAGATSAAIARAAAETAAASAPHLGEAHLALALVRLNDGEVARAAGEARRAVELSPGLAEAHGLVGRILIEVGRLADGIRRCELAIALDPHITLIRGDLARAYGLSGDWQRADARAAEMMQNEPTLGTFTHARGVLWRRDVALARQALDQIHGDEVPEIIARAILAYVAGIGPALQHQAAHYNALTGGLGSRRRRAYLQQITAELHAFEGDLEGTLGQIHDAVDAGLVDVNWMDHCPLLDAARADPRFASYRTMVASRAAQVLAGLSG